MGYSKPLLTTKTVKPTHGQLIWFECGKSTVLHYNKPFALLQSLKKQMINQRRYMADAFPKTFFDRGHRDGFMKYG